MAATSHSSIIHPGKNATTPDMFEYLIALHLESRDINTANQKEIHLLKTKVTGLEMENTELKKDLKAVKEVVNSHDQESRSLTVRIFGVPLSEEEKKSPNQNKSTAKTAYDRIIRPLLTAAKANNDLDTIPQLANTIEESFRLGKGNKDKKGRPMPPPILVRLSSLKLKVAAFRNKRKSMPVPSDAETALGIQRFSLVEDLTPATFSKLRELRADERVSKAWTTEGRIKFILAENTDSVLRVVSVFDPINVIIK